MRSEAVLNNIFEFVVVTFRFLLMENAVPIGNKIIDFLVTINMANFEAELNALVASSASEARTPHIKGDTMSELTSRKKFFGS